MGLQNIFRDQGEGSEKNFFAGRQKYCGYCDRGVANVPDDELGVVVAHALARPECKLEVLALPEELEGDLEVIVEALSCNTSLKKMAVYWDEISSEQAELFFSALRENADSKPELIVGMPGDLGDRIGDDWVHIEIDLEEFMNEAKKAAREGRGEGGVELKFVTYEKLGLDSYQHEKWEHDK